MLLRRFFPTTPSLLHKEGSTSLLGLLPSGEKRKPLLPVALNRYAISLAFFSKTYPSFLTVFLKSTRPSLPLKKAPPLFSVFSPQGRRGNRYAIRLAGHQSPRQDCFSGDETAGGRLAETVGRDGTALLKDGSAGCYS